MSEISPAIDAADDLLVEVENALEIHLVPVDNRVVLGINRDLIEIDVADIDLDVTVDPVGHLVESVSRRVFRRHR